MKSSEPHIPGYELIRRDRDRNGGGVCFSTKTSLDVVVCSDLNVVNLENLCHGAQHCINKYHNTVVF